MKHVVKFYNARAASVDAKDFLKQVGHTERGRSITEQQFESMIGKLCQLLQLEPDDHLLDLCCGNGVITCRLADQVRSAVGLDFSESLIEIAKQNHPRSNLQYQVGNALLLNEFRSPAGARFSKVLMHGALQHFRQDDFQRLLDGILSVCNDRPTIVFGYVLEKGKESAFFDSPRRKFLSFWRRLTRRDVVGTWWDKALIEQTCQRLGLQCSFHKVDQNSDAFKYRFDLKIW